MGSYFADPFLQTIEELGFGFVVLRAAGDLCCVNRVVADIVESTVSDVEGREARCFMDACNFDVFSEQQALRRQGGSDPYDLRLLSTQGTSTRVYIFPTPLFDAGEYVGSCGFLLASSRRSGSRPVGAVPPHIKLTALGLLRESVPSASEGQSGSAAHTREPSTRLSTTEREVLERLTPSNSVEDLAHELGTSVTKVRNLLLDIYGKYGVRNRIELLALIHVLSDADGVSRPTALGS